MQHDHKVPLHPLVEPQCAVGRVCAALEPVALGSTTELVTKAFLMMHPMMLDHHVCQRACGGLWLGGMGVAWALRVFTASLVLPCLTYMFRLECCLRVDPFGSVGVHISWTQERGRQRWAVCAQH